MGIFKPLHTTAKLIIHPKGHRKALFTRNTNACDYANQKPLSPEEFQLLSDILTEHQTDFVVDEDGNRFTITGSSGNYNLVPLFSDFTLNTRNPI